VQLQSTDISFTAKIAQLRGTNAKLLEQLEGWKEKAFAESERVRLAEEELHRLREITEENLQKMNESNQQLQDQVSQYAATTEFLKSVLSKCFQGLGTTLPVLEELQRGVSVVVS
jgi:peptidoglycan hydrolase CwlO-like protein